MDSKILLIDGHPLRDSFCSALGEAYAAGARAAGAEVRTVRVQDLVFDPILHNAYKSIQPLEPDLLALQASIVWAEHLVFAFPIWWGMPPAKVKGLIDRTFHPGWAFKYASKDTPFQTKLLAGRTARIIATMDAPPWYFQWFIGAPGVRMMKHSVLAFCGIKPVRVTPIGSVRFSTPGRRAAWLRRMEALGGRGQ